MRKDDHSISTGCRNPRAQRQLLNNDVLGRGLGEVDSIGVHMGDVAIHLYRLDVAAHHHAQANGSEKQQDQAGNHDGKFEEGASALLCSLASIYAVFNHVAYLEGKTPRGGASITSDEDALKDRIPEVRQTGAIHECWTDAVITQMFPSPLLPVPVTRASVVPL